MPELKKINMKLISSRHLSENPFQNTLPGISSKKALDVFIEVGWFILVLSPYSINTYISLNF